MRSRCIYRMLQDGNGTIVALLLANISVIPKMKAENDK